MLYSPLRVWTSIHQISSRKCNLPPTWFMEPFKCKNVLESPNREMHFKKQCKHTDTNAFPQWGKNQHSLPGRKRWRHGSWGSGWRSWRWAWCRRRPCRRSRSDHRKHTRLPCSRPYFRSGSASSLRMFRPRHEPIKQRETEFWLSPLRLEKLLLGK